MKTFTRWLITLGVAFLVIGLSACGGEPQAFVEVRNPWIRAAVATGSGTADSMEQTPQAIVPTEPEGATETDTTDSMEHHSGTMEEGTASGATSAAYMILVNNSDKADRLLSATTDVAETVELHNSEMADGVMRMRPVETIDIPANSKVELQPGGLHIMLIGLKQDLNDGDTVNLTLTMENMGIIDLAVPVRQP